MFYNLRDKNGNKLYACCNWQNNQHKIYNAHDIAFCALYDAKTNEEIENAEAYNSKVDIAMEWIDNVKNDGLVYAPYEACQIIKELIVCYDLRH